MPEDTDYFYEDVVDLNDKTEFQRDFSTEKTTPAIPAAILSHYVPGDTPTLYAGAKPNTSNAGDHQPTTNGNALDGGTSYTFFGVPIPPLNLNNIWGQTKTNRKRPKDSRRNSLPRKSSSTVDGFTPMLPGTGGFRPSMATTPPDEQHVALVDVVEPDGEEPPDTVYQRNKSASANTVAGSNPPRYHFSSTTESSSRYDRFPSSDYGYSRFVNITTRDSLFESATVNSIVRSTAKPNPDDNHQRHMAISATRNNESSDQPGTGPHKSSTGNVHVVCNYYPIIFRKA